MLQIDVVAVLIKQKAGGVRFRKRILLWFLPVSSMALSENGNLVEALRAECAVSCEEAVSSRIMDLFQGACAHLECGTSMIRCLTRVAAPLPGRSWQIILPQSFSVARKFSEWLKLIRSGFLSV